MMGLLQKTRPAWAAAVALSADERQCATVYCSALARPLRQLFTYLFCSWILPSLFVLHHRKQLLIGLPRPRLVSCRVDKYFGQLATTTTLKWRAKRWKCSVSRQEGGVFRPSLSWSASSLTWSDITRQLRRLALSMNSLSSAAETWAMMRTSYSLRQKVSCSMPIARKCMS